MKYTIAKQVIAGFLLILSQRLEKAGANSVEFQIGMSRSDIGSYLGLASETVSRVLTRLQKSGCIELRHKRLRVIDREALTSVAGI